MNKFNVRELTELVLRLESYKVRIETSDVTVKDPVLSKTVASLVSQVEQFADKYGYRECRMTAHIAAVESANDEGLTHASMATHLEHFEWGLLTAIMHEAFLRVSSKRSDYVDNSSLFGPHVYAAFPSARSDITAAGNCSASECHTAIVFHLMRAVEWGIRALGVHLGVRTLKATKRSGKTKFTPVPYSDWEHILNSLQIKVDAKIVKMKRGAAKQDAQEFYYPVLQDLRGIRDAWRNHIMHTRREYTSLEADAIMEHVKRLMTQLATSVSEI